METQHRPVRSGALTLLFTAVLLCLAVLAVLSLATAHADAALARRSIEHLQAEAAAEQAGQAWLAAVDAAGRAGGALPAGTEPDEGGGVQAALALADGSTLYVAAAPGAQGWGFTRWQLSTPWEPDVSLDVWGGM